ncbi:urease accessory protein F-like [Gigantopelta aegis]|uniref:urease accessory protein F-like n=1 Tax=Gigantopelta aegis TaxID=1735272 RepID=UPI001B889628|nr:urease accessory protein F-like [Gigantopelta aegis]
MDASLLTLLQLSDSAFPSGGFSHSLGLESAIQHSLVGTKGNLQDFIVASMENAGSFGLPFVHDAYNEGDNVSKVKDMDDLCEACLSNHIAKKASIRQGNSFIDSASRIFHDKQLETLSSSLNHRHFAVVFGVTYRILGFSLDNVMTSFMFSTLRTLTSSAVRLDRIGPIEAQQIQYSLQSSIPDIIARNLDMLSEDASISFPVPDTLQNAHGLLFSKLFFS